MSQSDLERELDRRRRELVGSLLQACRDERKREQAAAGPVDTGVESAERGWCRRWRSFRDARSSCRASAKVCPFFRPRASGCVMLEIGSGHASLRSGANG